MNLSVMYKIMLLRITTHMMTLRTMTHIMTLRITPQHNDNQINHIQNKVSQNSDRTY